MRGSAHRGMIAVDIPRGSSSSDKASILSRTRPVIESEDRHSSASSANLLRSVEGNPRRLTPVDPPSADHLYSALGLQDFCKRHSWWWPILESLLVDRVSMRLLWQLWLRRCARGMRDSPPDRDNRAPCLDLVLRMWQLPPHICDYRNRL